MKPSVRRRLWLLGPARVDQTQKYRSESKVKVSDAVPRFRSRRTVALLGYIAAERRPITREFLSTFFWPDEPLSKGRANLSRELHNLAQILPDCWESDRQTVAFVPSESTVVDLYTLLELELEESWGEAVELLGGEFLDGLFLDDNPEFENWLLGERENWRGRAETILKHVIEGQSRRGRYTDALGNAQRLQQLAPWDESAHRCIMRLLAWMGQRGAALRQFESCKQVLIEELGVEPASETISLYRQILAGELNLPPQLPAFLTTEKARHEFEQPPFVGRRDELAELDAVLDEALAGRGRIVFITGGPGRGKTALMDAFAQRSLEAHPDLLVVKGNCNAYSGIGDPYLPYRDVMAMLTGDVEGRWDAGAITREHAQRLWAALPLVVQALLRHGPHLVDVLTPGESLLARALLAEPTESPWLPRLREHVNRRREGSQDVEQNYLFQQVTNVLSNVAREQPLLMILDDIQWADAASISLLFHLGRRLTDADIRLMIVCAYRPEEIALGRPSARSKQMERHPLEQVLSEFKRSFGDVWVQLGRAEDVEERKFVDALVDIEPNRLEERFRVALFDRTKGHPLFTIELLRAMKDRGDLLKDTDSDGAWIEGPTLDWEVLPARIEAVIEERINRLDPELQDILTIASVEGEMFTAQVVAEVGNMPERSVLRRLSHDLERQHRLVREQEEILSGQTRMSRYRIDHAFFQDYLYKRLSRGEKRLLHGDVAKALENLYQGQLDEMAIKLAHHFHAADDNGSAFRYFSIAGERAARSYDSGEAIKYFTHAIQLTERVSPDATSLAKVLRGRGLAFERMGEFDQSQADHDAVLQMACIAGDQHVEWRALLDLGRLWGSRDYNQAQEYYQAALELARRLDDPACLAESLNWMGNWHANDENHKRAIACHQESLAIFEDLGERRELANTLDLLAIANMLGGDLNSSVRYYDRAIEIYRELDDRPMLASSLTGRATTVSALAWLASFPVSPPPDAISDFEETLRIAGEIGSVPDQAWAYYSLGMLHTVHGRFGRALEDIQCSLRTASEIEHREYLVGAKFALGLLYTEFFAPEQARGQLEEALTLAKELRSATWTLTVVGALASTYLLMSAPDLAHTRLKTVLSPQTAMDTLAKRYCWARRAELALTQDDPVLALDITERLIVSAPGLSPERVITFLWKLKAEALDALGRTEESVPLLHAAIENAQATEERFLLWRVHASLGHLYQAGNNQVAALKEFSAARELIRELANTVPDKALIENFLQSAYSRATYEGR